MPRLPAITLDSSDPIRCLSSRAGVVAAAVTSDFLRRPAVVSQVKPEDKVRVVEELTRDDHVAAEVTTGLLRRPDVAFKAMSDDCPDYGLAAA